MAFAHSKIVLYTLWSALRANCYKIRCSELEQELYDNQGGNLNRIISKTTVELYVKTSDGCISSLKTFIPCALRLQGL